MMALVMVSNSKVIGDCDDLEVAVDFDDSSSDVHGKDDIDHLALSIPKVS